MTEAQVFPDARGLLRERGLSALALLATLLLLAFSLTQTDQQIEWLYNDNGIMIQHLQLGYALLALALVPVLIFEPQIRRELREAHALGLVALVGLCVSFLVVRLIKPDEAWRFFRSAGLLWWVIAHAVLLCVIAVLLVLEHPDAPASARTRRYALLLVALGGAILLVLHVASVGNFMSLDLPDEVWLGSAATNFAARGAFYSSYLAGAFGNPDPLLPRYYLLMGEWIRLVHDSSLVTLRTFSLLVGAVGVALTALALSYKTSLTLFQKVAGIVVMLGFSPLVRASHNLRMDVGLSVYGALLLLGLLGFLRDKRSRWLILLGGALFVGMELTPPLALAVNFALGCALIVLALRRRAARRQVVLYAGVCLVAGLLYAAIHFLPDIAQNLANYASYTQHYYQAQGTLSIDFANIYDYWQPTVFVSPVEGLALLLILWGAWRSDRALLLIFGAMVALGLTGGSGSYGYLVVFAPFFAYFAARAFRSQVIVTLGAFLLIPAMISAPIFDMTVAVEQRANQHTLDEIDLLSWRVPDGATVWGDTVFWFTLHDKVNFVGRAGPTDTASVRGITLEQAVQQLSIDVIICNADDTVMCAVGEAMYGAPYEFNVSSGRYRMYSALGSQ